MNTLAQPTSPRFLWLIWVSVLLAPMAWSISLGAMFWLTDPVCQGASRSMIFVTGGVCVLLAIVSSVLGWRASTRVPASESSDFRRFLLRLAMWSSAIFALVIAVSLVPVTMLTPCPL
jgi:hypothetical protein